MKQTLHPGVTQKTIFRLKKLPVISYAAGRVLQQFSGFVSSLVSCISISYAAGRVPQQFSGFVSSLVSCISISYSGGRVLQRFSGFVSSLVPCISLSYALVESYNGSVDLFLV